MKKFIFISMFFSVGFYMNAQSKINMIWCGNKDAGNFETTTLSSECLSEAPRFWEPEKGEFKCLSFKMLLGHDGKATLLTSNTGDFTSSIVEVLKTTGNVTYVHFFDVIVQSPKGETELCDRVYKVNFKP